MHRLRDLISRGARLTRILRLISALSLIGTIGPAQAAEDLFASMAVQRLARLEPAPALALPNLEGNTVHLQDFRGKVVLLGFFTTA
jgi:cytochrome oxidase Cu insertion factor (SCO1/SenC/PrrC family)